MRVLGDVIELYIIIVFVRILLSWFPLNPNTTAGKVLHVFSLLTDPILRPLRRIIPPLRVGGMAIDLAPLALLIALEIIHSII
jgi:YggT family protein